MPVITVTTWPSPSDEKSRELMQELTKTVKEVVGCPLDKITVYIQEIPPSRWAEGGSVGSDPDFPTASRATQ